MAKNTYLYRLQIFSEDGPVRVDFRDPQNVEGGNPGGTFRFARFRDVIEPLQQRAFAEKGNNRALSKQQIRELGEALFNALFDDELRTHFLERYSRVVHGEGGNLLRLELEFDEARTPHLAALPWEFMRAPHNQITGALWLATAPRLILARTRGRWLPADDVALPRGEKLTIGLAVAAPADEQQRLQDGAGELGAVKYQDLLAGLAALAEQNEEIVLLPPAIPATRDSIDNLLEQRPHIFHFVGHGRLYESNGQQVGEIGIVRNPQLPVARWIDAEQFGGLLSRHRPAVVVMQACEGAAGSTARAFTSVASQIVSQNVPAVVAMQYEIRNATARSFAREFYRRLAQGKPVDESVQEGRHEISDWHETLDFAIPVLYMRSRHGQIFAPGQEAEAQPARTSDRPAVQTTPTVEEQASALSRTRQILLQCGPFGADADVRTVFATTPKLRLWQHNVPAAGSPAARVDALIAYLIDRFRGDTKENGLVLFLQALSEKAEAGGMCKEPLARTAEALSRELQPPDWL